MNPLTRTDVLAALEGTTFIRRVHPMMATGELARHAAELHAALSAVLLGGTEGRVGADHPETSRAAAESLGDLRPLQRAVLRRLIDEPLTDEELEEEFSDQGYATSTVRKRRTELAHAGLVDRATYVRNTRSGRSAVVWQATFAGRELMGHRELAP